MGHRIIGANTGGRRARRRAEAICETDRVEAEHEGLRFLIAGSNARGAFGLSLSKRDLFPRSSPQIERSLTRLVYSQEFFGVNAMSAQEGCIT